MFELSLIELLFIGVMALVVIGPQDLPRVMASLLRFIRQCKAAFADIHAQMEAVAEESGLEETRKDLKTIIDQHGEVQEVYDISDFLDETGRYKISGPESESSAAQREDVTEEPKT